jgi:hypothetical protein
MKRLIINAAVLGFVVGILSLFAIFFFFNVPEGAPARFINVALVVVCPPLLNRLDGAGWVMGLVPFLNAVLYALITFLVGNVRAQINRAKAR